MKPLLTPAHQLPGVFRTFGGLVLALGLLGACAKPGGGEADPPPAAEPLFQAPAHFPAPVYDLSKNPLTKDGVLLGRTLFYDGILSRDGTVACAECHRQDFAFTHHTHDVSHGIGDRTGTRNAPALQNLAWGSAFFLDGGVHDLDLLPLAPIENPVEMDEKMSNVLEKLRKTAKYPALFKAAYGRAANGSEEITTPKFLKALSQFMVTLVSANSRYDRYRRGEVQLTADEAAGLSVFKAKCASCHAGELFTDGSFRNNGLGPGVFGDLGRETVTEQFADRYKFRVPSLRNVSVSRPYMHDGRLPTLDAVLDHYARGVQDTPTLDPLLKQDGRLGIALTEAERGQLLLFLNTLNDSKFLTNPAFSEPD